jgi:hypothetical protein
MLKRVAVSVLVALTVAATAFAQEKKPVAAKEKEATKTEATRPAPAQPINVKIEVSITDQTGNNQPAKKVVTMIASDQQPNSIRSSASLPVKSPNGAAFNYRSVTINVDARPTILAKEPNKVLVSFGLEYLPKSAGGAEELEPGMSQLNERLTLVLESGKPMVVSQAADPTSDRKITVEVTATILK